MLGGERDAAQQLGLLLGVIFSRFTARPVECSRCSRPRWTRRVVLLDADDVVAVAGEDLGDAGAHGAEADHADGGELAGSVSVMARMLPRRHARSRMWEASRPTRVPAGVRRPPRRPVAPGPGRTTFAHSPRSRRGLPSGPLTKASRVLAEAGDELAAPAVRLVGHHDDGAVGAADVELAPGAGRLSWERSRSRNIWSPASGSRSGSWARNSTRRWFMMLSCMSGCAEPSGVRRLPRAAHVSPDQPLGDVEVADLEHLATPRRRAADDGAQRADVARGGVERRQEGRRGRRWCGGPPSTRRTRTRPRRRASRARGPGSGSSAGISANPSVA